jgi:predicted HTH domain antitoxin
MTPEQIIDLFDRNPNLTLTRLARLSGWSLRDLKSLLLDC